jgi:site-specific recombinase XerD
MTEEMISKHNLNERVANNTFKHYREHIKDIRAWLKINAVNSRKP